MLVHQRYFPLLRRRWHACEQIHLITSNGNPELTNATSSTATSAWCAARLYDAKFFYDEDLKTPLEAYVDDLDAVVFQEKLGTTLAKIRAHRQACRPPVRRRMEIDGQEEADILRAAHLCKADLVTGAVVEFTSVQGIMGSYYAEGGGGDRRWSPSAIADHYRPRFSGDNPPATRVGKVVAVADKLDTICGLFAVDQAPTGSSDPFALRRSALRHRHHALRGRRF